MHRVWTHTPTDNSPYDDWNYCSLYHLGLLKSGLLEEITFKKELNEKVTSYFKPLIPCLLALREEVFPNRAAWVKQDRGLYD